MLATNWPPGSSIKIGSLKLNHFARISIVFLAVLVAGCAVCRRPPLEPVTDCAEIEINRLAIIPLESRNPISLTQLLAQHGGLPFVDNSANTLLDLTLQHCELLAARSSRLANQLHAEKAILCRNPATPAVVLQMLDQQAAHERNQAAGQAMRAYLGLVEVYLQHELIVASKQEIQTTSETVNKLRESRVTVAIDDGEFQRRHLELDERAERARHQQFQLNSQLNKLLNLEECVPSPIWTNFQSTHSNAAFELCAELAVAFENRSDLAGVESLASADDSKALLDWLRTVVGGTSPLMGIVASSKGFLRKRQTNSEREQEASQRQNQVSSSVEAKRELIELEVSDAIDSLVMRLRVIEMKQQATASLENTVATAEKAKDLFPVDLKTDLENRLKLLTLRSELIHEIVEYESDIVRLHQSQGLLGREAKNDF